MSYGLWILRFMKSIVVNLFFALQLFLPIAVQADSSAKDRFPFGVCVDIYECKDEQLVKLIKDAGIGWVRQVIRWDLIEPTKGRFEWAGLDAAIKMLRKNGINIYGLFLWKKWIDPTTAKPEALSAWANFVQKVVQRYKGDIKYWEVWNEPDYDGFWNPPDARNYVRLLQVTYTSAKKVDPECKIISGGLMGWGPKSPYFPFIDELYKQGAKGYFDILAIHPHTMPDDPQKDDMLKRKIEDAITRIAFHRDSKRSIWITEIGWPSNRLLDPESKRGVTPQQQAEYLKKAMDISLSYKQIEKIFWYGFRDVGTDPSESEHHYGLVSFDLKPKPSYFAYKDYIRRWKKKEQKKD